MDSFINSIMKKMKGKRSARQSLVWLPLVVCAWLVAVVAVTALGSCSRQDGDGEATKRRLSAVDDSVMHHAPSARRLIEEAMHGAGDDSVTFYEYYLRMGKYFMLSETPDSMQPYISRTIAFALRQQPSPRVNALMAAAYSCEAIRLHNFHQHPDSVINLYTRAYRLLMASDNLSQAHELCGNLGDAYYFMDNLPEAAAWYRRALFLVDSLSLPQSENVTLYLGLARIYLNLNDYKTSRRYYEQTERQYASMQPSMQAYFLNDYGSFFYYSGNYAEALKKFLKLERMLIANHMERNFDMYLCRLNLADVFLNLGRIADAQRCLSLVEDYMLKMRDPVATSYVNTIKIGIALRHNDLQKVKSILRGERIDTDPGYNLRHIRNRYLREYYVGIGDYRMAYELQREDDLQTDSSQYNRSNMRAYDIMGRFTEDTLRLHHSLEMEQKNAYIYRTTSLASILAFVALALVSVLVIWFVYARKQMLRNRISIMQLKLTSARNRINPHFVFNVLNNKIMNDGAEASSELLELTRLIRTNLDMSTRMTVSLSDELAFVRRYVEVQKYLLGDNFSFSVSVTDGVETDSVQVPSMFLQILVENAIVHGLKGREGFKSLTIAVARHDEATVIRVEDNGRGFDARSAMPRKRTGLSVITQSLAALNEHSKKKLRFSLHNVIKPDGSVGGCVSELVVPDGMKLDINA